MAEQGETGKDEQWIGCTCPTCRALFRVPLESVGHEVECPGCEGVVAIPEVTEEAFGSSSRNRFRKMEELPGADPAGGVTKEEAPEGRIRVRKRKTIKNDLTKEDDLEWEKTDVVRRRRIPKGIHLFLPLALVVIAVLSIGAGVMTLVENLTRSAEEIVLPPSGKTEAKEEAKEEVVPPVGEVEMGPAVKGIKAAVDAFLTSQTVEEMLTTVRGDEKLRTRIREYYQTHEFLPSAAREVAPSGLVQMAGELWSVNVVLPDFSLKPIAVEKVGEEYLVDWESWVGYSEMSWEEFLKTRPQEPVLFRVRCSADPYYNFNFSDEDEWQSYRLRSADGKRFLYGYVPRDSELDKSLIPLGDREADQAFVLKLRFAKPDDPGEVRSAGAERIPQVLIDSVEAPGWVISSKAGQAED